MLRRQRLDAVEREGELDVHRLLDPQRAVVVERGDALGLGHEVGRAFRGHRRDEIDDRGFGGAVVPGRQRIGWPSADRRSAEAIVSEHSDGIARPV